MFSRGDTGLCFFVTRKIRDTCAACPDPLLSRVCWCLSTVSTGGKPNSESVRPSPPPPPNPPSYRATGVEIVCVEGGPVAQLYRKGGEELCNDYSGSV